MMLWIHPILQAAALVLATYVLYMGYCRFCFQHLRKKAVFNWKRHVLLGKVAVWLWLAGLVFGLYATQVSWGTLGLTGSHYTIGLAMLPFLLVSLVTGYLLQKPSGKRPRLALTHGTANAILYLMALSQTWSGIESIRLLLLE